MPDVTVIADGDRWTAQLDGEPVGDLRAPISPDGRRFLLLPTDRELLEPLLTAALTDLAGANTAIRAMVDADDADTHRVLTGHGFAEVRREGTYRLTLPTTVPTAVTADGVDLVSAADADLDRLRLLDEALREDIPGSSGWRWTPERFRAETLGDTAFDPATYLVAVDRATGEYVGLLRVWMNPREPRLGCLAVRADRRRTRVTAALVTAVLAELVRRGHRTVITEVSDDNRASLALLARADACRTSTDVELVRPAG